MSGKDISVRGADGSFGGYLASPASGHGPGVIVIQEIFGVNKVVRDICDQHAARGRFALAPDLFWRLEPGVQLTDRTQEDWGKAFGLMQRFEEVLRFQEVRDPVEGVVVDENRAQQALFRFDVVRSSAVGWRRRVGSELQDV